MHKHLKVVTELLAAAALAAILGSGCSSAPPRRATPSITESPAPDPTGSAGGALGPAVVLPLERVPAVFEKRLLTLADPLPPAPAVAFMDPLTRMMEVWSVPQAADLASAFASRDGRLLVYQLPNFVGAPGQRPTLVGAPPSDHFVTIRDTGTSFRVPGGVVLQGVAGSGTRLLTWHRAPDGSLLLDLLDFAAGTITTRNAGAGELAYASPEYQSFVVIDNGVLRVTNFVTGNQQPLVSGIPTQNSFVRGLPEGRGFLTRRANGRDQAFDWHGDPIDYAEPKAGLSPDGSLVVATSAITLFWAQSNPSLSVTTVSDAATGEPLYRIRGALSDVWLADGSTLVVRTRGFQLRVYDRQGHDVTKQRLTGEPRGREQASPRDPSLLLISGALVNIATGDVYRPSVPQGYGPSAQWSSDGHEVTFSVFFQGGKGGQGPPADELLPPVVELPPFADIASLAVDALGDCLNLREQPTTSSASLNCLPDKSLLFIVAVSPPDPAAYQKLEVGGYQRFDDRTVWLHVIMPDGTAGWVDSRYVSWPDASRSGGP